MLQLFRPKSKDIDILPPPPPFPAMDFEEEPKGISKPVEFSKIKQDFSQNVTEFHELLDGLDKSHSKDKKISARQKKLSKKELKRLKKLELKQKKEAKSLKKSEEKHVGDIDDVEKLWLQDFDDFQDLGIENLGVSDGLKKPKKGKYSKKDNEIEFPDTLDELNLDYAKPSAETKTRQKPKELEDAEKEIRSAIESIKKQEKQSFFSRLFSTSPKLIDYGIQNAETEAKYGFADKGDKISQINKKIEEAREDLMNSNLEAAKRKYIEAMQIYNHIRPEEQAKVYNDIKNLYSERKNAEEMKI